MEHLPLSEMPPFVLKLTDKGCVLRVKMLNAHGLHARPSALFFEKILRPNEGKITVFFDIEKSESEMQIVSVFDLMSLGLECGTVLDVRIEHNETVEQAQSVAREVYDLFKNCFFE